MSDPSSAPVTSDFMIASMNPQCPHIVLSHKAAGLISGIHVDDATTAEHLIELSPNLQTLLTLIRGSGFHSNTTVTVDTKPILNKFDSPIGEQVTIGVESPADQDTNHLKTLVRDIKRTLRINLT